MKNSYVKNINGNFYINDKIFRFIGANMYELANVDSTTTENMVKDAANEGFQVVRFWAFEPMKKEKLKEICDIAKVYKIKIIPVLADKWGYLQSYKINKSWYNENYKKEYLKYVIDVIKNFKDRDEILIWELINEPVTDSFNDIYNFAEIVSKKIKEIDPNHLISLGTIGGIGDEFGGFFSRFKTSNFKNLYSIKSLDAISIHDYSFNSNIFERLDLFFRFTGKIKNAKLFERIDKMINYIPEKIDEMTLQKFGKTIDFPLSLKSIWQAYNHKNINIAKQLKKPIYIGEVGFKKGKFNLRKKIIDMEIKKYFEVGISGILLWSFEAQGRSLDGHDYGFNKEDKIGVVVRKNLFAK